MIAFGIIEKKAETFISEPSYTSQIQKWEGAAPTLKNTATKNRRTPKKVRLKSAQFSETITEITSNETEPTETYINENESINKHEEKAPTIK